MFHTNIYIIKMVLSQKNGLSPFFELILNQIYLIHIKHNYGKVALITGATSGISEATACMFASNGYSLIIRT